MNPHAVTLAADMVDDGADLSGGIHGTAERPISRGWRIHLGWARRAAIAQKVAGPDVETAPLQMIGPRAPFEAIADRQGRGKRKAVDIEHGIAVGRPAPQQQRIGALAAGKFQMGLNFSHVNFL